MWRTYTQQLMVTIALDGRPGYQPLLLKGSGQGDTAFSFAIWDTLPNNPLATYNDALMPSFQQSSCTTFAVNLQYVSPFPRGGSEGPA